MLRGHTFLIRLLFLPFLKCPCDGLQPRTDGLQPNSDGLQPNSKDLQPTSDGLQSSLSADLWQVSVRDFIRPSDIGLGPGLPRVPGKP